MDSRLDELIESSAPQTAPRTPELRASLRSLVAETEAMIRPARTRSRRRMVVTGIAALGVLGMGAAATAAADWFEPGLSPTGERQVELPLSNGPCEVTYTLDFQREPARVAGVGANEWTEAIGAAEEYVQGFDVTTISIGEAIEKARRADRQHRTSSEHRNLPADERGPTESPDALMVSAVGSELLARTRDHLTRRGLPADAVSMSSSSTCDLDGDGQ